MPTYHLGRMLPTGGMALRPFRRLDYASARGSMRVLGGKAGGCLEIPALLPAAEAASGACLPRHRCRRQSGFSSDMVASCLPPLVRPCCPPCSTGVLAAAAMEGKNVAWAGFLLRTF